jgi:hypothetical protein
MNITRGNLVTVRAQLSAREPPFGAAVLVCRDEGDCHAEQGDLRAHSRRRHGRPIPGHGDERVFKASARRGG